jgi:nitrogenase molybdenum-iron protein NifN
MATVEQTKKACTVNPLKMSAPIGAALAFLGIDRCLPLLHGAQGCTAFGLVLFVRHFRETIPLQTTAMNEVTTILGGLENIEQALVNIHKRANPALVGLVSTGLTETKGDDVDGYLKLIRERHPEFAGMEVVYVSTPDFVGGFQDGWGKAVNAMVNRLAEKIPPSPPFAKGGEVDALTKRGEADAVVATVPPFEKGGRRGDSKQVNILAPCHFTPADIEELRDMVEAFGLDPIILPDLSGSLDGHVPETFLPHTLGGTKVEDIRRMGASCMTLAFGEQMRAAAETLRLKCDVPCILFERTTGLDATDRLLYALSQISGQPVPARYRRQRSQLQDAMLDGHFQFGGKRVAVAAEPDLLLELTSFLTDMGAVVNVAVAPTASGVLETLPVDNVVIGDLEDFESRAKDCDLLVTHSHGRQAAERLGIPLYRAGIPTFDRLGAAAKLSVGYRGMRALIFEIGNLFIEQQERQHFMETGHEPNETAVCTRH